MSWPYGLNSGSFVFLVSRAPNRDELQSALDAQDFLGRLELSQSEPVEVQSDTPPLYEWSGLLDGQHVAFRIGQVSPAKLPGQASSDPGVLARPLALWSTDSGTPDVVGAGAMAIYSWAVATRGAAYEPRKGAAFNLPAWKRGIDVILTYNSLREDDLRARYHDIPPEQPLKPGETKWIEVHK